MLAAPAAAQTVHYEGSLAGTTGRYIFTERTTAAAWTTGLALEVDRLTLRASVPVWWQDTPLVTASGMGRVPSGGGGEASRAVRDSGAARRGRRGQASGPGTALGAAVPVEVARQGRTVLGDPVVSAGVRALTGTAGLTLGVAAKIPFADPANFGTGELDVGGSASLTLRPADRTLIGIDISYWHLGDFPDLDFRDPVAGGVSLSRLFGSSWAGMVSASAATSSLTGFAGPASAGGAVTRFVGTSAWSVSLQVGLSETSPDIGGGVSWRVRL